MGAKIAGRPVAPALLVRLRGAEVACPLSLNSRDPLRDSGCWLVLGGGDCGTGTARVHVGIWHAHTQGCCIL